ncbi:MAG: hypothetical protein JNJ46_28035 [Myxococcales bacterium]|nr:hypothetical protein [Myxococcales bacterium]
MTVTNTPSRGRASTSARSRRVRLCIGVLASLLCLDAHDTRAHTFMQKQQVCPLDGTRWTATLDGSGTSFGQHLDMKPFGPTPAPWRLAVCPKDHFVMYQETFSQDELAVLRPLIESAAYQALAKDHTEYFLLGRIFEHLKRPAFVIGLIYVKASWQVDHDPARYREYATEALRHYEAGLAKPAAIATKPSEKDDADQRLHAELLAGELERRLGRFEAAQARFGRLQNSPQLSSELLRAIVAQQLALIAARDAAPHRIERPDEKKTPHPAPPPVPPPPT